jgi:hypothetical protein
MTWDASISILATAGVFVTTSSTPRGVLGKMNIHEDERAVSRSGSETGKG